MAGVLEGGIAGELNSIGTRYSVLTRALINRFVDRDPRQRISEVTVHTKLLVWVRGWVVVFQVVAAVLDLVL